MPETKLKTLHLGKSIGDLKVHYSNVTGIIKGKKMKLLNSTAQKILDQAGKYWQDGDEELGYVYYMKYLAVVTAVQHSEEYKQDKQFFTHLLGKQNVTCALERAEKLAKSLEQRYELMKIQEEDEKKQLELEEKDAKEQLQRKEKIADESGEESKLVNGLPGISDVSISSKQLYNLLREDKKNILILDSRSASCYAESHMSIGNCINVPEEIVRPGSSAAALEKLLPSDSKVAWSKRRDADYVVLLDWSTTEKTHQPGTNLYTLKNILLKWDPGIIYQNEPVILDGGYEDWLMKYPMYTTNPKVEPPSQNSNSSLDDLLDDIQYPNFIEPPPLVPQPSVDRTSKPQVGKGSVPLSNKSTVVVPTPISIISGGQSNVSTSSARINTLEKPGVDRSSKAIAMQTYEERSLISAELLRAKQKLMDLKIESERKSDKEWEILRLNKEKEAEEERVQLLQSREEELLLSILKLEEKHRDQEAEKQILKDEIEKYKRLGMEEMCKEEKARKQKEEVEAKEEERKMREAKEHEEMREKERKTAEERQKVKEAEKAKKIEDEKRREKEKGQLDNERGIYYTHLKSDMPSGSSSMKRSHSSPNIAQMLDEDLVKNKVPQFDRAIKPLHKPQPSEIKAARQRNFNAVYGMLGRGLTGLKNLGNSCYMNSIIQCINNTTPLAFYFVEGKYRDDVNYDKSNTRGEVAEEVAAVIRALWSGQYRSIACKDLKSVVGQYRKQFQGYEQQDSHEFLTILMDWLHEDLNKPSGKSPLKEVRTENMNPAERAWEKFKRNNQSLIRTLFYGQQKSTVRCCQCNEESITFEAFSDLSLPLPNSSNKCALKDCMHLYLNGERISGWNCPSCKDKRDAIKKFDIWRLPPILVIHLNRFYHDGWWRKRQTYVDFPFTMDMQEFTPVKNQRYINYNLYGVSNHYGSMEGGHYTAYCKNNVYSKWYKFDDHEVSEMSNSDVRTGAAYILFYASAEIQVPGNNS